MHCLKTTSSITLLLAGLLTALSVILQSFPQPCLITPDQDIKIWQVAQDTAPSNSPKPPPTHMASKPEEKRDAPQDPLKSAYLDWMQSVSNQDRAVLEMIWNETSKYPLRDFLLAIIYQESWPKFNPWSYSKAEAVCLMQINPKVWLSILKKKGIVKQEKDLWQIDKCINAGNFIITHYLNEYHGDVRQALNAYVGGDPKYVERVIKTLNQIALMSQTQRHST